MRARIAWLLIAVAACGVEPTTLELRDPVSNVHAILSAGSDSAVVLVTSTVSPQGVRDSTQIMPITGAAVRIRAPGISVDLAPDLTADRCLRSNSDFSSQFDPIGHLRAGCYVGRIPGGIRAGETYDLDVVLPGGERITGRTTVPLPVTVLAPVSGARIDPFGVGRLFMIAWQSSGPRAGILFGFRPLTAGCRTGFELLDELRGAFAPNDSVSAVVTSASCTGPGATPTFPAELVVTTPDSSWARYVNRTIDEQTSVGSSIGLTGAIGLFGSEASVRVPLIIVGRQ